MKPVDVSPRGARAGHEGIVFAVGTSFAPMMTEISAQFDGLAGCLHLPYTGAMKKPADITARIARAFRLLKGDTLGDEQQKKLTSALVMISVGVVDVETATGLSTGRIEAIRAGYAFAVDE